MESGLVGAKRSCVENYLRPQPLGLVDWARSKTRMAGGDVAKFNIHAIGIAVKRKRTPEGTEEETGELCVQVAVLQKFDTPEEVAAHGGSVIPKTVTIDGETYRTDVVEEPPLIIERHSGERANPEAAAALRPVRPGCSINRNGFFGTLGAFCRSTRPDERNKVFLLSCRHVLARFDVPDPQEVAQSLPIFQPGARQPDPTQVISAGTDRFVDHMLPLASPPRFAGDAAIAALQPGIAFDTDNLRIGRPAGVMDLLSLSAQQLLRAEKYEKFGRTTGLTTGTLSVIRRDMLSVVDGKTGLMDDHFVIRREAGSQSPMSDPGDSGAMMFHRDTKMAAGLVIGAPTGPKNDIESIISPLTPLLKELEVELIV